MASGHGKSGGKNEAKEGMSSEPPYIVTQGKVMVSPVIFQEGIPGSPNRPKMRGDAKPIGSWNFPESKKNPSNSGPYGAFGIKGENQGGRGGKRGSAK
jgi:hypothetical protein